MNPGQTLSPSEGCRHAILTDYSILSLTGQDVVSFLQGQLCGDIGMIAEGGSLVTAATTAKGRVIAMLRVLRTATGCEIVLPASLAEKIAGRLAMYKLRARVQIDGPLEDGLVIGLWGTNARGVASQIERGSKECTGALTVPGIEDTALVSGFDRSGSMRSELDKLSRLDSTESWNLAETRAGIPEIDDTTSESFIPQMINLDLLGGVSFTKGCYVGQEVVARAHHLGRIKRRSRLFVAGSDDAPEIGRSVYSHGRSVGTVVRVAGHADGFCILALTPSGDGFTLGSKGGSVMEEIALPYALPEE